ncbi:serine hydrolase FSH [Corynascus novoguineensis]|uniref:Serine hydrolase FSH n=1 Tax=Corynascus novoguineensis TaxID=1126955 RepID=A0AAN7CT00_9PEZI|nr:serine hydrolase FSH [Corynascus novoguineensis]
MAAAPTGASSAPSAVFSRRRGHFRLVYADAPFLSQAGPCVLSVYADWGSYRRWLRWADHQPSVDALRATGAIDEAVRSAIVCDDALGATGDWVGILGFSQGAKVAASLLFRQQQRENNLATAVAIPSFRFGMFFAGRGPLVALDPDHASSAGLPDAAALSGADVNANNWDKRHVLRIPSIHVHGLKDPGIGLHRYLRDVFCEKESTRLVEWNGEHRMPLKNKDVEAIFESILSVAQHTGVF